MNGPRPCPARLGSWRLRRATASFALGLLSLAAGAEASGDGPTLALGGSIRLFATAADYPDLPGYLPAGGRFARSLLRLTAEGRLAPWLRFDVHAVNHLDYSSEEGRFSVLPRLGGRAYQAWESPWVWLEEKPLTAGFWFDRLSVKIALPGADLTVGRQAVAFGEGWLWSPLDVFLPLLPWDVDRDYRRGVDAVRLDVPLGGFSGATVVAAAGREIALAEDGSDARSAGPVSWSGSALLSRVHANARGWDLAIQGGKIYGGFQLGGAASGEIGGLAVRLEAAWFEAAGGPALPAPLSEPLFDDHLSLLAGLGRVFRSGLVIGLEYFHNGAAAAKYREAAFLRSFHGSNLQLSTDLVGITAGRDLSPRLRWTAALILSLDDLSGGVQPALVLALGDETEFHAGATVGFGEGPALAAGYPRLRSEFGSYPDALYLLLKHYF